MLRTPCHEWHVAHHGRMVDFAGWEMPVQYTSITAEHHAVRNAAGMFDIAHMGRLKFTGPDAARFLNHLLTADVESLAVGQVRYSLVTNERGGILDDVLVYRFDAFYLLVVNAANRTKILEWIAKARHAESGMPKDHRPQFSLQVEDLTAAWSMLAIQGPRAIGIVRRALGTDYSGLGYYWGTQADVLGVPGIVSRTGYTGEDGLEVVVPAERGLSVWEHLIAAGAPEGLLPCGLGARDTLRLEAAMPLYGHELNESIDPFTAGLGFAVKLDKPEFIGKHALAAAKNGPHRQRRVGLVLAGKRIAREGAELYGGDQLVGRVTSGTFSPTLEKSIAMAYVAPDFAAAGTRLEVDIRGKREPASVVKLPFYRRT